MVNNKFQLTKQSSDSEIKAYFIQVLNLSRSKEEFPVNLDEVWPLVYSRRDKAVRALRSGEIFMEGIDYQVFPQNGEKSDTFSHLGGKVQDDGEDEKLKGSFSVMGRPQNVYMISIPCLEYLIARKVRSVFEVYRQVFHKVAGCGISLGNQVFQSVPMGLEETLAPLARYHTMIEDRFSILKGTLSSAGIEDGGVDEKGSLAHIIFSCRDYYQFYRDCINKLVYLETAFKLEGSRAFTQYDDGTGTEKNADFKK